ncbi:hypothetical protein HDU88_005715 [Geranomyces variabilis]|nr:hypothetical protein HDU88_005715 [Geranomyces variabilis]
MFDYALEECMDDAKNVPTRFGTYAVHFCDGLIHSATEKTLRSLAAALLESKSNDQTYRPLRELYNDERDWLPQLDAVVDLIHPSHHSLVSNVTRGYDRGKSIGRSWEDFTSDEEASSREAIALPLVDDEDRIYHRSDKFQWLPSEFHLATGSDLASFSSYINNLNPASNFQHYDAIGMVLGQLVPLFEHVLTDLQSPRHPIIDWECKDHYRLPKDASDQVRKHFHELMKLTDWAWDYCDWQNLALNFPTLPRYQGHPAPSATWPRISLRDRQLQVIVKKTMVLLTPSKPDQPAGMWHIEGLEHEHVVAVGVYCLDVENVSTPSLSLRSAVGNPQRYKGEDAAIMAAFGMVDQDPRNQYWGDLHLLPGRCATFPTVYQQRFSAVSLLDRSRNGHSTLVCFLLIDPTTRITSTLQIPPQQSDWTKWDNDALVEQQAEERLYLTRNLDLFEDSESGHMFTILKERIGAVGEAVYVALSKDLLQ